MLGFLLFGRFSRGGNAVELLALFEAVSLGADLGLPSEFIHRHPFPGPGLAIRIICQEDPYLEKDFPETQVLCRLVVNYRDMVARVSMPKAFSPC